MEREQLFDSISSNNKKQQTLKGDRFSMDFLIALRNVLINQKETGKQMKLESVIMKDKHDTLLVLDICRPSVVAELRKFEYVMWKVTDECIEKVENEIVHKTGKTYLIKYSRPITFEEYNHQWSQSSISKQVDFPCGPILGFVPVDLQFIGIDENTRFYVSKQYSSTWALSSVHGLAWFLESILWELATILPIPNELDGKIVKTRKTEYLIKQRGQSHSNFINKLENLTNRIQEWGEDNLRLSHGSTTSLNGTNGVVSSQALEGLRTSVESFKKLDEKFDSIPFELFTTLTIERGFTFMRQGRFVPDAYQALLLANHRNLLHEPIHLQRMPRISVSKKRLDEARRNIQTMAPLRRIQGVRDLQKLRIGTTRTSLTAQSSECTSNPADHQERAPKKRRSSKKEKDQGMSDFRKIEK
jgi:hypothetical protein